jgi:coronin-7
MILYPCGSFVSHVFVFKGSINGLDISPFVPGHVACASEDGSVGVFDVPLDGLQSGSQLSTAAVLLEGHEKRALGVFWHNTVSGLLASHDGSKSVKLWDVSAGSACFTSSPLGGLVTSVDFDGPTAVVFSKDNVLSLFDFRAGSDAVSKASKVHEGTKGGRATVLGGRINRILCTGFGKGNGREARLFDRRDLSKAVFGKEIDNTSSSSPYVSFDEDLAIVYIWGKGDGNIRVFEATENALIDATEFKVRLV